MSDTMTRAELERVITDLRGDRPKLMIGTRRSIANYGGSPRALAKEYAGRAVKVEVA